jgi:hypothetical protein
VVRAPVNTIAGLSVLRLSASERGALGSFGPARSVLSMGTPEWGPGQVLRLGMKRTGTGFLLDASPCSEVVDEGKTRAFCSFEQRNR